MARISLRVDDIKQTVRAFILYRAPDCMKVDVMGMLGGSALTAVSGEGKAEIYLPREKQLIVDYEGGYVLFRLAGIDLRFCDPASMFLGIVPLSDGVIEVERSGDRYLVVVQENGAVRRVWIEGDSYVPVEEEIYDASGDLLLRRTMSRYEKIGGARLPRRIDILDGRNSVRIEFRRRRANRGIKEDRFRLNVPSGVSRIVVGEEQP